METFEDVESKVIEWASDRHIFSQSNPHRQYEKLLEEVEELGSAMLTCDMKEIVDGIGDSIVVLINLAAFYGTRITPCVREAYNQIKHRKGKMVGGIFVKEN